MTTNERITELIKENGLTFREAAKILGVHVVTVQKWVTSPDNVSFRHCKPVYIKYLEVWLNKNRF